MAEPPKFPALSFPMTTSCSPFSGELIFSNGLLGDSGRGDLASLFSKNNPVVLANTNTNTNTDSAR